MVQGRVDAKGVPAPAAFSCVLGDSAWFDMPAAAARHLVVEDELAVLMDSLQALRRQPACTPPSKAAKVFVISPFRKVFQACQARIRQAGLRGIECGTVHTFQGKEAEIVFLVLGTAPGQNRRWCTHLGIEQAQPAQCRHHARQVPALCDWQRPGVEPTPPLPRLARCAST